MVIWEDNVGWLIDLSYIALITYWVLVRHHRNNMQFFGSSGRINFIINQAHQARPVQRHQSSHSNSIRGWICVIENYRISIMPQVKIQNALFTPCCIFIWIRTWGDGVLFHHWAIWISQTSDRCTENRRGTHTESSWMYRRVKWTQSCQCPGVQ